MRRGTPHGPGSPPKRNPAFRALRSRRVGSPPARSGSPPGNRTEYPKRRTPRRRLVGILSGVVSAAAVVIVALTFGLNTPARAARNRLTQAIASMEGVHSIRIELRIRTSEQENFDFTDPNLEFVPHTLEAIYTPSSSGVSKSRDARPSTTESSPISGTTR